MRYSPRMFAQKTIHSGRLFDRMCGPAWIRQTQNGSNPASKWRHVSNYMTLDSAPSISDTGAVHAYGICTQYNMTKTKIMSLPRFMKQIQ